MQTLMQKHPLQVEVFENGEMDTSPKGGAWKPHYVGSVNLFIHEGFPEITVTIHNARLEEGERVLVTVSTYPNDVTFKEVFIPKVDDFDDEIERALAYAVNHAIIHLFNEIEVEST